MPTKWLQERPYGSKNDLGMPPRRAFCGSLLFRALSGNFEPSLFCFVVPSFRALSGRLKFTVRRHTFNDDPPPSKERHRPPDPGIVFAISSLGHLPMPGKTLPKSGIVHLRDAASAAERTRCVRRSKVRHVVFFIALICTTIHRIPASANSNEGPENGGLCRAGFRGSASVCLVQGRESLLNF